MNIGRNASEEFLETILYLGAYNYTSRYINEYIGEKFPPIEEQAKDRHGNPIVDAQGNPVMVTRPNILGEAVAGAANVALMGALMFIIRYEERFLDKFFAATNTAIAFIVAGGKDFVANMRARIKRFRGYKASRRFDIVPSNVNNRVAIAQLVSDRADAVILGRQTQYQSGTVYNASLNALGTANDRNRLDFEIGNAMAQTQLQVMMFKLFTKNFSADDMKFLRTVMRGAGANPDSPLTAADLNKIADFMFVRDPETNNIVGMTDAFVSLASGLNLHNKREVQ